jgi:spermidine synthase
MTRKSTTRDPVALVLLLFFLSGALALVYQVVWSRMMMQVFGSTAVAVGTVLAAFMTGMALGSWKIGTVADRSPNCLLLYARLEIGIAVTALLTHVLLDRIGPTHLAFYDLFGAWEAGYGVFRFLMAFLLVVAPTLLMGATLPVLTRLLVQRRHMVGMRLSHLYAVNTLGAVLGVLITGFFLIGRYGIHVPVYLAVMGNLLVACIAWLAAQRVTAPLSDQDEARDLQGKRPTLSPAALRLILFGLGLSGLTSFAYEIYWTRSLVFILGNSTYALSTMLSAFLLGIALGAYLLRFLLNRIRDRAVIFGWIQVLLGLVSALALPMLFLVADPQALNQMISQASGQVFPLIVAQFGVSFLVMLVPAVLIGATFPLVGDMAVEDLRATGSSVGRVYAVNTLGNVLGALLPGFILLNWLGIQGGILTMAVLNITLGFMILSLRLLGGSHNPAWRLVLPLALIVSAVVLSRAPLEFQFPSEGELKHYETLFYREGPSATTKVYWDPRTTERHMSVDGIVIGGTGFTEFKQLLLAHLPKLLLKDVSTELSVGVGSGILAGESALHDRVDRITGVEIEPSVVEGAVWFSRQNHQVLDNPRFDVVLDDIGNFLRTTSGRYQVISADEKTADSYASNGFSYSLEYYELLRQHLANPGLVAQWVPTTLPPTQYQMILNTFSQSFPYVQLWYFPPAYKRGPINTVLVGSNERIALDYQHISRELATKPFAYRSLGSYGLTTAEALVPHFVADERTLRPAVRLAQVNSLDHPRYEFYYPWNYVIDRQEKFLSNHEFIMRLRLAAYPGFIAEVEQTAPTTARLRKGFAAEDLYLEAFLKSLTGTPRFELYRSFDEVLALAPWNDSLRARIYAQYSYFADTTSDPAERERLRNRARAIFQKKPAR